MTTITIDLNDIFKDEDRCSVETVNQAIQRQVIEQLASDYQKTYDKQLSLAIDEEIKKALSQNIPPLIGEIMHTEYTPVDRFGKRGSPTTMKDAIIEATAAELIYKPKAYLGDQNTFTNAVHAVVKEQVNAFKQEFMALVDEQFKREALEFAITTLKQKLGLGQ